MIPSKKCIELLNYRYNQELYSSYIYKAMSIWLDNQGYTGSAKLWKKYSDEELTHADKAKDYLLAYGIMPEMKNIASVNASFKGLDDIIHISFSHEKDITRQCEELMWCANAEKDGTLFTLASWYVSEQIDELDKMQTWFDKLTTFGTDKIALRLLDNEMGG